MKYLLFVACLLPIGSLAQRSTPIYKNQSLTVSARATDLLSRMTLQEKIGQLNLVTFVNENNSTNPMDDKVKAGNVGGILKSNGVKQNLRIQKIAVEQTRLGIPILFQEDVIHGYKTIFPIPLGESCSWNLTGISQTAAVAATEASAGGIRLTYAPMVDISNDPRWGRISEGAGEDPYYASLVAAARVRGFQGKDLTNANSLMACVKHFAGYGAALAGRDYSITDFSERTLREKYLPPFKAAIDAGVGSLMTAYTGIDGTPATSNQRLLKQILRKEFNFNNLIITDWETIKNLVKIGVAKDEPSAVQMAIESGIDMDMTSELFQKHLATLIKTGKVKIDVINAAVSRVLEAKFKLGLFDQPFKYLDEAREVEVSQNKDHLLIARQAARESIVLLKNDSQILPLKKNVKTIAVIGPLANRKKDLMGWWGGQYSQGKPDAVISLLEGIQKTVDPSVKVIYAEGIKLDGFEPKGLELIPAAVEASLSADIVVLAVGEEYWMSGESGSISMLNLPGAQLQLIDALAKTGKPIVSVLFNGRPYDLRALSAKSSAVVEAWFPGTMGGLAVADVLFGDYNPSGKLTVTFPYNTGQIPVFYNSKRTSHDLDSVDMKHRFANNYLDITTKPLYPFGFGLSYTNFSYSSLKVVSGNNFKDGNLQVSFVVKNTGEREGIEVAQLYIKDKVSAVIRNVKDLKGFERFSLKPGEARTIKINLTNQSLSFLDRNLKEIIEPGDFELMIGSSSEDIRLRHDFTIK
ncbi:beta-glucosidase BglX [Pedobacter frigiditerrae]|uniref:beta-glucosidase n=1 Tax=Pedobacter frigiditerrae TaxID=2530452 RepID=A0A4R0MPH8_9SPHI|nr:beta-glucosidase BglX [Pedobacter frigiditerrae]TCC88735.1 beta-glucosidase BglX [Pedobacter frigiditerrae]